MLNWLVRLFPRIRKNQEDRVARALWEDFRIGKTASQGIRTTTWEELVEGGKTRPLIDP